jgi:hypothetical protein
MLPSYLASSCIGHSRARSAEIVSDGMSVMCADVNCPHATLNSGYGFSARQIDHAFARSYEIVCGGRSPGQVNGKPQSIDNDRHDFGKQR